MNKFFLSKKNCEKITLNFINFYFILNFVTEITCRMELQICGIGICEKGGTSGKHRKK
jgi:hypothetical protein